MSQIILAFFDWSFVVGVFVGGMELTLGCLSLNLFFSLSRMTNYEGLALETSSFLLSSWWKFYGYKLIWNHREDQSALAVYYFSSHSLLPGAFLAHFHAPIYVKGEEAGHGRGNWPRIIFPVQMANAGSVNGNQNYKFPVLSHERKGPPKRLTVKCSTSTFSFVYCFNRKSWS